MSGQGPQGPTFRRRIHEWIWTLALVAGCSTPLGPGDDRRSEIRAQRDIWDAHEIHDYTYEIRRNCFCAFVVWVRVEVQDDSIRSVTLVDDDPGVPPPSVDDVPTLAGLFDLLEQAVDRKAHSIQVSWDDVFGFPSELFIDYEEMTADEELGYQVRAFQPGA